MEPKEKAKELIERFRNYADMGESGISEENKNIIELRNAKQCALICCNEVISAIEPTDHEGNKLLFWQEVKRQIENS